MGKHWTQLPEWLHWLACCPSTNTWAIAHFGDLHYGDVVFTRRQVAGRGQHGRTWYAPAGVLTASIALQVPTVQLPTLSLASGLAVVYAVEDLLPSLQGRLRLKWPNDVLIEGHKLAGILCEVVPSSEANGFKTHCSSARVAVGVGLNRCADFAQAGLDTYLVGNAISLHQVSSVVPDELPLLERLRHYLLQTAALLSATENHKSEDRGLSVLLPALRQRDALLGSVITLDLQGELFFGQAAGIDEYGRLLVLLESNELRSFASGRVLKGTENKSTDYEC